MIELRNDGLVFTFPEVHPKARLRVTFQRTLRIPDDGKDYPLPPGLGEFPLRHVDDFAERVPDTWLRHGGVMLPMYQAEAMWLSFQSDHLDDHEVAYPFAVKVATGKIDAVTGESWAEGLRAGPQNYMVVPEQPWLDGYCVERGFIRQFVAMPLGAGYSTEEQITGKTEHGGLQIAVYPMRREIFEKRFPKVKPDARVLYQMAFVSESVQACSPDMGLAPGGRMRQEIYEDPFALEDWEPGERGRCFVHLTNSMVWRGITGKEPPTVPPTSVEYTRVGLPWFDYYGDGSAVSGSQTLNGLKSVVQTGKEKGDVPLPENEAVAPESIVHLRKGLVEGQVREGSF